MKPEDALTDGPILDMKANRGAEPKGPVKDAGATKPASGPAASVAPEIAAAAKPGPGFGALATSGLIGGVIGAALLFLLAQTGALAPKGQTARLDALDKRIAALAPSDAVAGLEKRVSANETAIKPLAEAISRAEATPKAAGESSAPAPSEGSAPSAAAPADLVARLDALDQRVSALQEEPGRDQPADSKLGAKQSGDESIDLADLDVRLKALETKSQAQGAPAVPEEDLAPKLAALQSDAEARAKANEAADKALGERLDQLQKSLDGRVTAATEAVQQVTQASRQAAEAGKTQAEEAAKTVERRLQEQGERIATLDKAVDGSAKAATVQAALRVVAADRIATALDTGAPYADALASLRGSDDGDGAKLEPLAAFADAGAPAAATLAEAFRPIADKIAADRRAAQSRTLAESGGIGARLMNMAESLVQVTPAPTKAGAPAGTASTVSDEPEAKVQEALDRGRLADAAQAFAALPEEARAQAKEFGAKLKAAADARAAASSIQADAFKALSAPASGR